MMPPLFPRERTLRIAVAIVMLAGLGIFALLPAPGRSPLGFPVCAFFKCTGLPCPFCGGTRSASAFLHGDINRALYLNPIAIPAVLAVIAIAVILVWEGIRGRALTDWAKLSRRSHPLLLVGLLGVFLWWFPHVGAALRKPKIELLDLNNPIAKALYESFHPTSR